MRRVSPMTCASLRSALVEGRTQEVEIVLKEIAHNVFLFFVESFLDRMDSIRYGLDNAF